MVREGYKQTEVGVIPEDWDFAPLESVVPPGKKYGIVDGPFGSNLKSIHYRKSGIPIISSGYVTEGRFVADDYIFVDEDKFKQEKRSAVSGGDIVMAKIGARCGSSAILPAKHPVGILSGNALKISVDEERHSTYFIWQVLWNLYVSGVLEDLRTVGAQPAVSIANLKKYKIVLPPEKEQRAIATALSDVDALIAALDQLIAKQRHLKTATMQQLLTGKKRLPRRMDNGELIINNNGNPVMFGPSMDNCQVSIDNYQLPKGYKQTEVGVIPEDWEALQVEQLARYITVGFVGSMASLFVEEGIPLLRGQNIFPNHLELTNLKYISSETHRKWSKSELLPGDVVIVRVGYPGTACVIPEDASELNAASLVIVRPDQGSLIPEYLSYTLNSHWGKKQIFNLLVGGAQQVFNTKTAADFTIPVPSVEEQRAIATVLSDMDGAIAALEARRAKTQAIKQGMMQQLLTGKVRLLDEGIDN